MLQSWAASGESFGESCSSREPSCTLIVFTPTTCGLLQLRVVAGTVKRGIRSKCHMCCFLGSCGNQEKFWWIWSHTKQCIATKQCVACHRLLGQQRSHFTNSSRHYKCEGQMGWASASWFSWAHQMKPSLSSFAKLLMLASTPFDDVSWADLLLAELACWRQCCIIYHFAFLLCPSGVPSGFFFC